MRYLSEITDPAERAHFLRVRDLADCLATHDDPGVDRAVSALMADRPAYWRDTGYGDQWTGAFLYYLNTQPSFAEAYADYCAQHQIEGVDARFLTHVLDHLIPLNDDAIIELARAYEKLGTFRAEDELEARERHAIFHPRWPIGVEGTSREQWYASLYHKAQERYRARNKPVRKPEPLNMADFAREAAGIGPLPGEQPAADAMFHDPATSRAMERV